MAVTLDFIFRPGSAPPPAEVGAKAAALAALRGRGPAIPDWFVLLPQAGAAELSSLPISRASTCLNPKGISPHSPGLAPRTYPGNAAETYQPQRGCAPATIPPAAATPSGLNPPLATSAPAGPLMSDAVLRDLTSALAELCPAGEQVAVRSSALAEDGPLHSFAGQFESFLMVRPDDVPAKVAAIWQSAFSARVRAYCEQHRLPAPTRPPAVLVQRMIHAEAAGVAFGIEPVSGRRDLAVICAVPGPGDALVSGERDADTWHVDGSGEIILRSPASTSATALSDAQVRSVAQLVRRAGEIFGQPQDIEWAFEQGQLYLLQSRAITSPTSPTSLASPGSIPDPAGALNIWDNSNIVESYSGVTTPLTFSLARRAYEGVYRQFCRVLAVPGSRIAAHDHVFRQMLGLIRGRVYYNLLNWYRVLALLPGFTVNRRFMEQMMGVKEELPEEVLSGLRKAGTADRVKDALALVGSLAALIRHHFLLPRTIRRFHARLEDALGPTATPLTGLRAEELAACFLDLEKRLLSRWDAPLINDFFAMIFYGVLRRLLARWSDDTQGTLQNDLLCGQGGMISAEPARLLRELARLASPDAEFVRHLCEAPLASLLIDVEERPGFKSAYQSYLEKFGDRCLDELKLESLTLHDDPLLLLRSVGHLARSSPAGGHTSTQSLPAPAARTRAEARLDRAVRGHPWRSLLLPWVLRHTRARVADRENLRFERTRLFGRVRRIFLELGRRLQEQGHLEAARDVYYLEIDEVLGFVAGTATTVKLKELTALRQAEFSEYRASEPPPHRFTTRGIVSHAPAWTGPAADHAKAGGEQRQGMGCCPGLVRGRIRKVLDPRTAVLGAGNILVAERTDPGWILIFPGAAGLLIERGSLLSHSAIVARELRIPTIVSIDGLTDWLEDGDDVEFDGSTGIVTRHQRAQTSLETPAASASAILNRYLSINAETADFPKVVP